MTFLQTKSLSKSKKEILFLVLAVALLYHRALWGTIVSIDDVAIMKFYGSAQSLLDVLRPGEGYYYRPLIALSYFLDFRLLGQDPMLMHLENVLIHGANTVLLYLLARRLFPSAAASTPLLAALIFAAHPVNCEAVSWIAGRTDPLAALFVLLSSLSLCKALESGRVRFTLLSALLLFLGIMAKETAVMFVPASFLLIAGWRSLRPEGSPEAVKLQGKVLCLLYLGGCLLLALIVAARTGSHNGLSKLVAGGNEGMLDASLLFLSAFGFYLKKLLLPWPLNFAITSVSQWYALPGAAALLLVCCAARKRNPFFLLASMGLLFLLPPLVVAAFDLAWTVVAERYLYIPSAFLSLALAGYLGAAAHGRVPRRLLVPAVSLCIACAALLTFERSAVWRSNLALFTDATAKTPDFGMLHNELAVALAEQGRFAEAEKELESASSLHPSELLQGLIGRNRVLIAMGKAATPEMRRDILKSYGWERIKDDRELLTLLRRHDYSILKGLPSGAERDDLVSELLEVSERLYSMTGEPLLLYNNGQLLLHGGDRGKARSCFERCAEAAPDGAYYKAAAVKLAASLAGEP